MRSYISNVENKINKRRAMNKEKDKPTKQEDKPEDGKVYSLTGAKGTACIANGNTWKESEVNDDNN
jgi:hypothetical protein